MEETLEKIPMRILQRLRDAKSLALCLMARTCWGFSRVHAEIDRANLGQHAEEWKWSSLWCRERCTLEQQKCLVAWPLPCPRGWMKYVNDPETEVELNALRRCVNRGQARLGGARRLHCFARQTTTIHQTTIVASIQDCLKTEN